MTHKDLKKLIEAIEASESFNILDDIVRMMKDIVVNDPSMLPENKIRFLFLYVQFRNECSKMKDINSLPLKTKSSFLRWLKHLYKK